MTTPSSRRACAPSEPREAQAPPPADFRIGFGLSPFILSPVLVTDNATTTDDLTDGDVYVDEPRLNENGLGIATANDQPHVILRIEAAAAIFSGGEDADIGELEQIARTSALKWKSSGREFFQPLYAGAGTWHDQVSTTATSRNKGARRCRPVILEEAWEVDLNSDTFQHFISKAKDVTANMNLTILLWGLAWKKGHQGPRPIQVVQSSAGLEAHFAARRAVRNLFQVPAFI